MIITSIKDNLHRGLNIANRALQSRSTMPITQNVLIQTTPHGISLTVTNLQLTITTQVEAIVDREGSITIPSRMLTDFVNTLPNEPVKITVPPGSMIANITCASSQANINGANPKEFPPSPFIPEGLSASINPKDLKTSISRTFFAAASEESRPVLTGVSISIKDTTMTMAAADGFRLAISKTTLPDPSPSEICAIIPATTLNQLNRLLNDQELPVNIMMDPNSTQVMFRLSKTELVSQLLQGEYPDYEKLVPTNQTTNCTFNTKSFLQAANTASIFAKESSNIIRMEMRNPDEQQDKPIALISAQAEELGYNQDQITIETMKGDNSKIAFNSKYLTELLSSLEPEQVILHTTVPNAPGVFISGENEEYRHVIMPMHVQW